MQQATPTPARGAVGGAAITPARPITGGGAVVAGSTASGGGGAGGGIADSRPLELVKACALAVTAKEKAALDNSGGGVSSSDGGGQYPCAMTMATPTPVHRGGGGGGGGGAFAPLKAGVGGGGGAAGGLGFFGRVEDGITAFLVLALSVLRYVLGRSVLKPLSRMKAVGVDYPPSGGVVFLGSKSRECWLRVGST